MPLIIKNKSDRMAFQFGASAALRSANELIDQLQAQLRAVQEQLRTERAQHRFNIAEKDKELAIALRELAEVRLDLARRDSMEAFAKASSPSASVH